jgi:hypothetical protein
VPLPTGWAIESTPNPSVLRVHTRVELTARTIETCPPAEAPPPLDGLVLLEGVRALDLHRYRARINLLPGADSGSIRAAAARSLADAWGPALPSAAVEDLPRAFAVDYHGGRVVAESMQMAGSVPVAAALFTVDGVAEVVLANGLAMVTLGRLFSWYETEPLILEALRPRATKRPPDGGPEGVP